MVIVFSSSVIVEVVVVVVMYWYIYTYSCCRHCCSGPGCAKQYESANISSSGKKAWSCRI